MIAADLSRHTHAGKRITVVVRGKERTFRLHNVIREDGFVFLMDGTHSGWQVLPGREVEVHEE